MSATFKVSRASGKSLSGIATLAIGLAIFGASNPAAAFDSSVDYGNRIHHYWHHASHRGAAVFHVRPHPLPYVYAYGDAPRAHMGYYFTDSNFCIPDRNNGYNGGFSTLAYGANGRFIGYVCN